MKIHTSAPVEIVISCDFLPKIGGAHGWLYEVYRRWHSDVSVITEKAVGLREREEQMYFDSRNHGPMSIFRDLVPISAIDFMSIGCLRQFHGHCQQVSERFGSGRIRLHALRAFPEGITAALLRSFHPRCDRLITYAHGEEILIARTSTQLRMATKFVYRKSDLVIVNSESTRRLVLEICPTARIACIHPGVDMESFAVDKKEIDAQRNAWGVRDHQMVVATVARMEPRKNHETVLKALRSLRDDGVELRYMCAGEGEQFTYLVNLAESLGVHDLVSFLGRVTDAEKRIIFAASDFHVMPSVRHGPLTEGFGIVFLEAAAAGRPSISGNVGGQPEAVLDQQTGFVVDGSSPEAVSGAMKRLAIDSDLRALMGQEAKNWAAKHDWSKASREVWEAVEGLDSQ